MKDMLLNNDSTSTGTNISMYKVGHGCGLEQAPLKCDFVDYPTFSYIFG